MSVTMRNFPERGVVTVQVEGRFDMSQLQEFQQVLVHARDSRAKYIIDLSATDQVLDSGIAILLMLIERVGPARLEVLNCSPELRRRLLDVLGPVEICAMNQAAGVFGPVPGRRHSPHLARGYPTLGRG